MKNEEKKALLMEKIDFGSGVVKDYKIHVISSVSKEAYPDNNNIDHIPNGLHVEYPSGLAVDVYWWKNNRHNHCSVMKDGFKTTLSFLRFALVFLNLLLEVVSAYIVGYEGRILMPQKLR